MSDAPAAASTAAAPAAAAPKKAKRVRKGPAKPRSHPPAGDMVLAAVKALKDRKGSSLQAIKKYIAAHYKCDVTRQAAFIRKALRTAVAKKTIVQAKGAGASGRFRLGAKGEAPKKVAKKRKTKKAAKKTKKARKSSVKKATATAAGGVKKVRKPKAAKKPKSPKKPKAPKVKKAKAPRKRKAAKPKKAAAPKAAK